MAEEQNSLDFKVETPLEIERVASIDWEKERPLIEAACLKYNLDVPFIMAIRNQERGKSGREFGVVSVNAPTYGDQLRICAETVAHRLSSFPANPIQRDPFGRICYSERWIAYFSSIWSPVGANNDPNGLNKFWLPNVIKFYAQFIGGHF